MDIKPYFLNTFYVYLVTFLIKILINNNIFEILSKIQCQITLFSSMDFILK